MYSSVTVKCLPSTHKGLSLIVSTWGKINKNRAQEPKPDKSSNSYQDMANMTKERLCQEAEDGSCAAKQVSCHLLIYECEVPHNTQSGLVIQFAPHCDSLREVLLLLPV